MDVENTSSNLQQFVTLLGKKYPVIQCIESVNMDSSNALNNVDASKPNDDSESITINDSNVIANLPASSEVVSDVNQGENTLDPAALSDQLLSDTNQASPPPSDQLMVESTGQNEDSIIDNNVPVQNNDNPVLIEVANETPDIIADLPSADDMVSLALSINEPNGQSFEYVVDAENSGIAEVDGNGPANLDSEAAEVQSANEGSGDRNEAPENNEQSSQIQLPSSGLPVSNDVAVSNSTASNLEHSEVDCESGGDHLISISGKLVITDYAQSEWKGSTYTAQCLRSGYQTLVTNTGCNFMRQVRGDNYCALRATAFQILSRNIKIRGDDSDWKTHLKLLPDALLNEYNCNWIHNWSFANRLQFDPDNRLDLMRECLDFFVEQKELSNAMFKDADRIAHFCALFNSETNAEIKLFEALKLMMLKTAVDLHHFQSRGEDVPTFAWLLFARDTSEDPQSLMMNHLNLAGNTGGLEQVEMCLLGQALQVTLRVFRPSSVDQEDFVSHYPDHMVDVWKKVDLIAEDDRHYNIVA